MPQGPRPSAGRGLPKRRSEGAQLEIGECGLAPTAVAGEAPIPLSNRIDTNPCLLILAPGLLWPGFRKAPARRRAGLLRCRRGVARRADLTCINLGLTGTKAGLWQKITEIENGAATLASRPGSAERGASGPGAFPAGGRARPLPSDFGDFLPWEARCLRRTAVGGGRAGSPRAPAPRIAPPSGGRGLAQRPARGAGPRPGGHGFVSISASYRLTEMPPMR